MHSRRNFMFINAFALTIMLSSSVLAQSDTTDVIIGKVLTMRSKVLGEDRKILLYTPDNYSSSAQACPVLYLLDGETHFFHVSGLVSFLSSMGKIPDMIVVGIENTNRTRDFTPTHTMLGYDGVPDSISYSASGGAKQFSTFLSQELISFIDANYRTQPFRILCGHSDGGLFAIYTFIDHPNIFNAFIAMSPSLWWDNRALIRQTNSLSHLRLNRHCFLFLSGGNEGGLQEKSLMEFEDSLKQNPPLNLEWKAKFYPKEWHGSVPHISMFEGLSFIYSNWPSFYGGTRDTAYISLDAFVEHYQMLTDTYGYSIAPSQWDLSLLTNRLLKQKRIDEAIKVIDHNLDEHPNSSPLYASLGKAYMLQGNKELAVKNYKRALEIDPHNARVRYILENLEK